MSNKFSVNGASTKSNKKLNNSQVGLFFSFTITSFFLSLPTNYVFSTFNIGSALSGAHRSILLTGTQFHSVP